MTSGAATFGADANGVAALDLSFPLASGATAVTLLGTAGFDGALPLFAQTFEAGTGAGVGMGAVFGAGEVLVSWVVGRDVLERDARSREEVFEVGLLCCVRA